MYNSRARTEGAEADVNHSGARQQPQHIFLAPVVHQNSKISPVDDEPRRVLARHRVFADTLHPSFAFFKNGRVRVVRSHDLDEFHHLHWIEEV